MQYSHSSGKGINERMSPGKILLRSFSLPDSGNWPRGYWRTGLAELGRSWNKASYLKTVQKMIPELKKQDLLPGGAGVRAQAIQPDGSLVDDFAFMETDRMVHVLNAPSPAATASFAIGDHIAQKTLSHFIPNPLPSS